MQILKLPLLLCYITSWLALTTVGRIIDTIFFGSQSSERAHQFSGNGSFLNASSVSGLTSRQLTPRCVTFTFTMACDNAVQNFITLKLWGDDNQKGALLLEINGQTISRYGTASPQFDWNMGAPTSYPGRFYRTTLPIPRNFTQGKNSVHVSIRGAGDILPYRSPDPEKKLLPVVSNLRPIYDATIHVDKYIPLEDKLDQTLQNVAIKPFPPFVYSQDMADKFMNQAISTLDAEVERFVDMQLFGDNLPTNDHLPNGDFARLAEGAFVQPVEQFSSVGSSESHYLDSVIQNFSGGNMNKLCGAGGLAKVYINPSSRHYKSAKVLERVVAAIDFVARAQSANGSLSSSTWVGQPAPKPSPGSPIEGVGTRCVGLAISLVAQDLASPINYLQKPVYGFGAGVRKDVWGRMLSNHAKFLVTPDHGRGTATNQDLFQITSLLAAYQASLRLGTAFPFNRSQVMAYVYSAAGLSLNPFGTLWTTKKGLSCEPWGLWAGGYDGQYGFLDVELICFLAQMTGDKNLENVCISQIQASTYFLVPTTTTADFQGSYEPPARVVALNFRNDYQFKSDFDCGGIASAAALFNDKLSLRGWQLRMTTKSWPSVMHIWNEPDNFLQMAFDYDYYAAIFKKLSDPNTEVTKLPFEQPGDFVWYDAQALAVVIKDNGSIIHVVMQWRRNFGTNWLKTESNVVASNVARILYQTPKSVTLAVIPQDSLAATAPLSGYAAVANLNIVVYGKYFIAINNGQTPVTIKASDLPPAFSRGTSTVMNLTSRTTLRLSSGFSIGVQSAIVLATMEQ